jgi:hypothetical protein
LVVKWRPLLVVRFGRGGAISSPTSTAGYVFIGSVAATLTGGIVAAAVSRTPLALFGLAWLRDPERYLVVIAE